MLMISIAIIGYGYWGPNIVRNLSLIPNATITWACDVNPKTLTGVTRLYPAVKTTKNIADVLKDQTVDAVIIATPTTTHFSIARESLNANKHILVEKPMTITSNEAKKLCILAKKNKRICMVDHTFLYTPAIEEMKKIIDNGELGSILSIDSIRTNLGLFQSDTNVLYDLATHDIAILDFLLKRFPTSVAATGFSLSHTKHPCSAYLHLSYKPHIHATIHVSWLAPIKIRTITIVGTKKMLFYDDMEPTEKIKLYDKGVSIAKNPKLIYQLRVGYRTGSMVAPHLKMREGLLGAVVDFVQSIEKKIPPRSDGAMGARVVNILERATASMHKKI